MREANSHTKLWYHKWIPIHNTYYTNKICVLKTIILVFVGENPYYSTRMYNDVQEFVFNNLSRFYYTVVCLTSQKCSKKMVIGN